MGEFSPALQLDAVTRVAGGRAIVDGVSLSVAPGEIVCLLGPSGCGKSTTLRMAAGIERASTGRVSIGGRLADGPGVFLAPEKRKTGLIFQDLALFPHLDVTGNVTYGIRDLPRAERLARAGALLKAVGLGGRGGDWPSDLSGGEQQRLALARAQAPKPDVMLLDEPFSSLDGRMRDAVRGETLALLRASGTATLLVTHDPDEAVRAADRIVLMRAGRIVQTGSPADFLEKPADLEAARFFQPLNGVSAKVEAGIAQTPFGPVPLKNGLGQEPRVTVAFRRRDLIAANGHGVPALVTRVERTVDGVALGLKLGGAEFEAGWDEAQGVRPGDTVSVGIAPGRAMIFREAP
jgi:iron(III) transport system ATP-binding protein